MAAARSQRGQASIEFVALVPLYAAAAMCCLQALLLACALPMAQIAADRFSHDRDRSAAVEHLPGSWRSATTLRRNGTAVKASIAVPSVMPFLPEMRVSARAVTAREGS